MKTPLNLINQIKLGLTVAALATTTGCVGYASAGYSGTVVVPGPPEVYFYGGYERRHDVHVYHDRGYRSRGEVHVAPPPRLPAPPHPPGLPRLPGLP